jgi:hypothetical protein
MKTPVLIALLLAGMSLLRPMPASAQLIPPSVSGSNAAAPSGPGQQCRAAIEEVERTAHIPNRLLAAIGRVETGRPDPAGGWAPWPWSIDVNGQGQFFATKQEAVAAVRALQARGVRSIDVGCLQINLFYHPAAFDSLEEAFDPAANAAYAARFLIQLHQFSGDWSQAAALYHSAIPAQGAAYRSRVLEVWPLERGRPATARLAGGPTGLGSPNAMRSRPLVGSDGLIQPSRLAGQSNAKRATTPGSQREAMR